MSTDYEPVVFENSLGETISNDPVFHAQRTLAAAGVQGYGRQLPTDSDDAMPDEYDDLKGNELKALAKERGVDITGLKTVGEVRAAFRTADAEAAEEDEEEGDDSTPDGSGTQE